MWPLSFAALDWLHQPSQPCTFWTINAFFRWECLCYNWARLIYTCSAEYQISHMTWGGCCRTPSCRESAWAQKSDCFRGCREQRIPFQRAIHSAIHSKLVGPVPSLSFHQHEHKTEDDWVSLIPCKVQSGFEGKGPRLISAFNMKTGYRSCLGLFWGGWTHPNCRGHTVLSTNGWGWKLAFLQNMVTKNSIFCMKRQNRDMAYFRWQYVHAECSFCRCDPGRRPS